MLLAASFSYADIAFLVIIALGVLLGILFGFHSTFKGFFLTIAIILCTILLLGVSFNSIRNLEASTNLENTLLEKTTEWGDIYNEPIYINEDGSFYVLKQVEGETQKIALENAMGDSISASIKGKFVLKLANWFIKEDGETLSGLAAKELTSIIVTIVGFIIYAIALGIVCAILRYIFKHMNESSSASLKWADKIAGGITQLALTFIFCLLVIAILHAIAPKLSSTSLDEFMNNSTICGYFYNNNPISNIFDKIFG